MPPVAKIRSRSWAFLFNCFPEIGKQKCLFFGSSPAFKICTWRLSWKTNRNYSSLFIHSHAFQLKKWDIFVRTRCVELSQTLTKRTRQKCLVLKKNRLVCLCLRRYLIYGGLKSGIFVQLPFLQKENKIVYFFCSSRYFQNSHFKTFSKK